MFTHDSFEAAVRDRGARLHAEASRERLVVRTQRACPLVALVHLACARRHTTPLARRTTAEV